MPVKVIKLDWKLLIKFTSLKVIVLSNTNFLNKKPCMRHKYLSCQKRKMSNRNFVSNLDCNKQNKSLDWNKWQLLITSSMVDFQHQNTALKSLFFSSKLYKKYLFYLNKMDLARPFTAMAVQFIDNWIDLKD